MVGLRAVLWRNHVTNCESNLGSYLRPIKSWLQPEPAKLAGTARQLTLQASTGPQSKSAQQAVGSLKLLADTADMQCLLCLSVVVQ